jgi:hypothetical protein
MIHDPILERATRQAIEQSERSTRQAWEYVRQGRELVEATASCSWNFKRPERLPEQQKGAIH